MEKTVPGPVIVDPATHVVYGFLDASAIAPAEVTAFGSLKKLFPALVDFHVSGFPGAVEKIQLCESAFMFGSASPLEPGSVRFAANVAGAGPAGGA